MRRDDGMYGVMGQVACMDSAWVAGSEKVTVNIMPMDKKAKTYNYFNQVRLLADSIQGKVILPNLAPVFLSLCINSYLIALINYLSILFCFLIDAAFNDDLSVIVRLPRIY